MAGRLSSRQLRHCSSCGKRKNLEWDARRKLCHDCLVKRIDFVVKQHRENKIPYHEAESEVMERLRISRLEAEKKIHPPVEEWVHHGEPMAIKAGEDVVEWDDFGNLVMKDGRVISTKNQEEE